MYNRARGFLAQEFSDSPDVVEMIVGVLAGFCDLHIHFQVGVKNHTQVSHWRHRCDLILTHMNEWYVYAFELLFTSYNQEFCLAVIHHKHVGNHPAPQFCHTISNGSDWGCLIRGRNGSEWRVNLMVIGIALGFWEVLFYDLEKVGNIDGEQHRAKAWSLWYSSGQLFLFWKSSFNLYLLSSLRKIWRELFQSCSTNTKTGT